MSGFTMNGLKLSGGMNLAMGAASPPAPSSIVAWNSEAYGGALTLSNTNLTLTSTDYYETAALTTFEIQDGNKYMFSITMDVYDGNPGYTGVGFTTLLCDLSYYLGSTTTRGVALYTDGNFYLYDGSQTSIAGGGPTYQSNGDVIDLAIDKVNHKCWWRINGGNWNNNPSDDPATNTGGTDISAYTGISLYLAGTMYTATNSSQFTINASATYAAPSGFTFVGAGVVASTPIPLQFNPYSTQSTGQLLSNGNLTVEALDGNYTSSSTYIVNPGEKIMFSVTMNVYDSSAQSSAVGFNSLVNSGTVDNYLGNFNFEFGYYTDGSIFINGSTLTTLEAFQANGDVIDMAIDKANDLWYFRVNGGDWNNNPTANPATQTGGVTISALNGSHGVLAVTTNWNSVGNYGSKFTINTSAAYSVPSGFTFVPGAV